MKMSPATIYTLYAVPGRGVYRDQSIIPSLCVEGGTIHFYVSNSEGTDPANPFDMQPDVNSPFAEGTYLLYPRFGFIAYTVASGDPVVTLPTGVVKEIVGGLS